MAAGAVTVGIYTTSSAHQCEYVVGHSGAKVFIAEDEEQLDKALLLRERTPDLTWIVVMDPKGLRSFSDPMVLRFVDAEKAKCDKEPTALPKWSLRRNLTTLP
jgi:long-chain acyl-CoA synthetase